MVVLVTLVGTNPLSVHASAKKFWRGLIHWGFIISFHPALMVTLGLNSTNSEGR